MTTLLPISLVRVKEFMTFKVFDASGGSWVLDEAASGDDLGDMITAWQHKTGAQIKRAEAPSTAPYREKPALYRVIMSTFVYYTPATEDSHDPANVDAGIATGPGLSGMAKQPHTSDTGDCAQAGC
jgi:hypothetical protein